MTLRLYYIASLSTCYVIAAYSEEHARKIGEKKFKEFGFELKTVRSATQEDINLHGVGFGDKLSPIARQVDNASTPQ